MTLHRLKVFLSVARRASYSRAAEELCLSQPAVSIQVRELERTVGAGLFERVGGTVTLTEAGRALAPYAEKILALVDETRMVMEELRGLKRGRIALAAVSTAGAFVVPPLLGAFRKGHPGISISLEVVNRATIHQRLAHNECDLAIMGRPPDEVPCVAVPFLPEELVVIAAPAHPLVRERRIPVQRLAGEVFIQREPGSGTRLAVEEFFRERGVVIESSLELGGNSAVKEAVASGMGVAVLSRCAVEAEVAWKRVALLDVQGFPLVRQWHIVNRKDKRLSQAAEAFKAFLLSAAARRLGSTPKGR